MHPGTRGLVLFAQAQRILDSNQNPVNIVQLVRKESAAILNTDSSACLVFWSRLINLLDLTRKLPKSAGQNKAMETVEAHQGHILIIVLH